MVPEDADIVMFQFVNNKFTAVNPVHNISANQNYNDKFNKNKLPNVDLHWQLAWDVQCHALTFIKHTITW